MAAIKFNISPLIKELKNIDLHSFFKNVGKDSEFLKKIIKIEDEWNLIIKKLSILSEKISKDGVSMSVKGDALVIVQHCESLTKLVGPLLVEGGSFVPGPIGIVCSLALATADFAVGNVSGGLMNLLGCIPFAKTGTKVFKPILNNIIRDLLKNPIVVNSLKSAKRTGSSSIVTKSAKPAAERIYRNIIKEETIITSKETTHLISPMLSKDINPKAIEANKVIGHYNNLPPSTSQMNYTLRTNTGRSVIFRYP